MANAKDKKKQEVAILFIHGLGLPSDLNALNSQFKKRLLSALETSASLESRDIVFHVETINYAALLSHKQDLLWQRLGFSFWSDWTSLLRVIPLRYLNLGLSFWGDPSFRQKVLREVSEAINRLSRKLEGSPDQACFILAGFSMGATIGLEFLNEFARERRKPHSGLKFNPISLEESGGDQTPPRFAYTNSVQDIKATASTQPVSRTSSTVSLTPGTKMTPGCHIPETPVMSYLSSRAARLLENGFTLMTTFGCALNWQLPYRPFSRLMNFDIPWVNIHYHGDVLASELRLQGQETSHVHDIELFALHAAQYGLMDNHSSVKTKFESSWRGLILHSALALVRITPASHMLYFLDPYFFHHAATTMHQHICSHIDQPIRIRKKLWSTPPPSSPDLFTEEGTPGVELRHISSLNDGQNAKGRQRIVFLYIHGMSTKSVIESEIRKVDRCLSATFNSIMGTERNRPISYELYAVTYYHLIEKDQEKRLAAMKETSLWRNIKETVLTRFPIAMSYWTEPKVRQKVNESFRSNLQSLIAKYKNDEDEVHFVVLGYTVGSIISSFVLGELQAETGSLLPSTSEKKNTDRVHMHALYTIGSPMGWFGNADYFTLPKWGQKKYKHSGWTNMYYLRDIHAIPLKQCSSIYHRCVDRELAFPTFQPHPSVTCTLAKRLSSWSPWQWMCNTVNDVADIALRHHLMRELLASVNGAYLEDVQVWTEIECMLRELHNTA